MLTFFVATIFNSCTNKSNQEQTVKEVIDQTVAHQYKTISEKQLDSLTNDQVMALFNDRGKKVLAKLFDLPTRIMNIFKNKS